MSTLDHHNVIQASLSTAADFIGYARDANGEAHGMNKAKGNPAITRVMYDAALERTQKAVEALQKAQGRLAILRAQSTPAERGGNVVDLIREVEGQ